MKILYAAMEHDYGDESRGPSFEQTNFKSALDGMGPVSYTHLTLPTNREV